LAKNYINNEDLLTEVIKFKENGVVSEELGKMLLVLANNYSFKGNFVGYTWREDMVGEAVLTCIKYLKNFNPEKSRNAFAYITQICKNSYKLYIKEQNTHSYIKDVCYNAVDNFRSSNEITYTSRSLDYEGMLNSSAFGKAPVEEERWHDLYVEEEIVNNEEIINK